ncbi:MAG TPA: hypothetical protein VGB07_36260 [Blastocatellia bacterium]
MNSLFLTLSKFDLPVLDAGATKGVITFLLAASAMMIAGMISKELSILKWVGIALAVLSTVFTLVIVGSHLSGRLVGMGKIGIIGTVGAELMAIICAWLATSESKRIAGVAMICQIVLTAVLLINASIALDLDWQETQASKASEHQLVAQRQSAEEQRKLIEKQAELASQLAAQDKRLAREFIRSGKATAKLPSPDSASAEASASAPLDIAKLNIYERYGLTVVPLFLGLLTVIALGLAAHSSSGSTYFSEPVSEPSSRHQMGFNPGQAQQAAAAMRSDRGKS